MLVGVMADSHDRVPVVRAALDRLRAEGVDTVVHAGDIVSPFTAKILAAWPGTLHVVYGNNDGERAGLKAILPQIQDGPLVVTLAGRRILVHHALEWCRPEDLAGADVVLTGHTHEVVIEQRDSRLYVNPGELCGWLTGRATLAVVDLSQMTARSIDVPQ